MNAAPTKGLVSQKKTHVTKGNILNENERQMIYHELMNYFFTNLVNILRLDVK